MSTLVLPIGPNQCVPRQVQASSRAPVSVSVLPPGLNRVRFAKHLHIRCSWGPAPALVVFCIPMAVVSCVSECLVDHVLHGICSNVMTLRQPTRNCGFLDQGAMASKVMRDKVCPPSLGTSVSTVRTPSWS